MLRDHGDHICDRSGQIFEIRSWSATVTAAMATKETSAMAHIHFLDMHGSVCGIASACNEQRGSEKRTPVIIPAFRRFSIQGPMLTPTQLSNLQGACRS